MRCDSHLSPYNFNILAITTMNRFLALSLSVIVAGVAFFQCDSKSKLADRLTGTWSAAPVSLTNDDKGYSSVTETFMFERDSTLSSGQVIITSMISLQKAAPANAAPTAPFMMSAAARSTISGTWVAVDDDDINLQLNPLSLKVEVDPTMVELTMNPVSGESAAQPDSMKSTMLDYVKAVITQELNVHYSAYTKIDDIKFHNRDESLKFEIGRHDYSLMRQTTPAAR